VSPRTLSAVSSGRTRSMWGMGAPGRSTVKLRAPTLQEPVTARAQVVIGLLILAGLILCMIGQEVGYRHGRRAAEPVRAR
jgi:hypothetical protein